MATLNPRQIEALRAVILTGGMTAAGEFLHISQPAVSRLIHDLESKTRLKLFVRRGNQLVPTAEGLLLYQEIERCFVGLEQIAQRADEIATLQSGTLRIAAMPAFALSYISGVLRAFFKEHPKISVTLHSDTSQNILELVSKHHFDVGIGAGPMEHAGTVAEPLPTLEAVCVLPARHKLARKRQITPIDLKGIPLILLGRNSLLRHRLDAIMRSANIQTTVILEATLGTSICALVAQELGVSVIDPSTALHFGGGEIVYRPFCPRIPYETSVVYSMHRPPARVAEEFARVLFASIQRDFRR